MFINVKRKFLSFFLVYALLVSTTSLPVFAASKTNNVNIGETSQTALTPIKNTTSSEFQTNIVFTGTAGFSELIPRSSSVYYNVHSNIPATSFVGTLNITDVKTGLSCGLVFLSKFTDNVYYNGMSGHMYRATLSGTAFNGTQAVSKVSSNAAVTWTNP